MDQSLSAHQFQSVYEELGYDLAKLGCIMLDIDATSIVGIVRRIIPADSLYYAQDAAKFWINGLVVEKSPHVTLLYGLLRSGLELKRHVDTLLKEHIPSEVQIESIGTFGSPYPDEPYACIVAHLAKTEALIDANERLKFLPHINTFPGFKAHLSLAYVKTDDSDGAVARLTELIANLNTELSGLNLLAKNINYGGDK